MSLCGTVIPRALALVAIATGVAFIHWAFEPLVTEVRAPAADDGPAAEQVDPADSMRAAPGDPAPEAVEIDTDPPAPAFDPSTLARDISTEEARALWETGLVTFIDARPQQEYEAGHIAFAASVPPNSISRGRLGELMEITGIGPASRVVIYCDGGSCDASHLVGLRLQEMGFTKIHIAIEGYPGWVEAGYETEAGPDPLLEDLP